MKPGLKKNTFYYKPESEESHKFWEHVLEIKNPSNPRSIIVSDLYIADDEENRLLIFRGREKNQDTVLEQTEESKPADKLVLLKKIFELEISLINDN